MLATVLPLFPRLEGKLVQRKIDQLREAMGQEDWRRALSIASRFPRLGAHADAIRRGHEAMQRPSFQRQLGRDPDAQVRAGIEALRTRYGSAGCCSKAGARWDTWDGASVYPLCACARV